MKQRVVVQAIIQQDGETLLIRRSQGRPGIVGKYELPGGTLDHQEQPDDGMRRHLRSALGIAIKDVQLRDVLSMTSREEGDIQHIFIVYEIEEIQHNAAIHLGQSYDHFEWMKTSEAQHSLLRDSTITLLAAHGHMPSVDNIIIPPRGDDVLDTSHVTSVIIYSDGGSRGNPGPSAAAFVIVNHDQVVLSQGGAYLGITTNNQAEYQGVRLGLERALELGIRSLEFRVDSLLVVNQLKGIYKIKNRELWPVNERIVALIMQFERVAFAHIPRERNQAADALVNKLLDEHKNDQP